MSSIFLELCQLRALQSTIQCDSAAHFFLSKVAQNSQNESFDLVATRTELEKAYTEAQQHSEINSFSINQLRVALVEFLELVSLFLELHPWHGDTLEHGVVRQWLYENHTRLAKYVIVAKYLEYVNLANMKANPMADDIPQWAIHIWSRLAFFRQLGKPGMAATYMAKLAATEPDFLSLCPASAHAAFVERISTQLKLVSPNSIITLPPTPH